MAFSYGAQSDVASVAKTTDECSSGRISMDYQPGHPHGFCSATWMGEVALCPPLHDPSGVIAALKRRTSPYPSSLRTAICDTFLWEVMFSIENVETAILRNEQVHVAGCAYRSLCCIAQVLFALNGRYLINEEAALAEAATLPTTIHDLAERVGQVWGPIGKSLLSSAATSLRALDADLQMLVRTCCLHGP